MSFANSRRGPAGNDAKNRRILIAVYGAALLYFVLKQCWYAISLGGFPDEGNHLSCLFHLARYPALLPDFRHMPLYTLTGQMDGWQVWSPVEGTIGNMVHPPLYYLLLSLSGGVRLLPDGSAAADLLRLRFCNILLSASGVALAFRLFYTRLRTRSPLAHALSAFAVATLPMLAYLGAGVNNDNLAFLAFVIFFAGFLRYQEDRLDARTYALLGLGFLLGAFSKLTTALMMLIMLGAALIADVIRTRSLRLILNRYFLIALPAFLLFLGYELYIRRTFGAWQPSLYNLDPDYFYASQFYTPPEQREALTFGKYILIFVRGMGHTWSSLYGENAEITALMHNQGWGAVYWVSVAAAVFAAVRALVRKEDDRIALPAVLGFFGAMAFHFYSNWKGYPISGYLGGCQARYYLAMIVPFAFLLGDRVAPLFERRPKPGRVLAVLLLLAWFAGDAPRLLFTAGLSPSF